jgi:hypothetical protein
MATVGSVAGDAFFVPPIYYSGSLLSTHFDGRVSGKVKRRLARHLNASDSGEWPQRGQAGAVAKCNAGSRRNGFPTALPHGGSPEPADDPRMLQG